MRVVLSLSLLGFVVVTAILFLGPVGRLVASDEDLFGLRAVIADPLDGQVLESVEKEGVVTEKIEFTTRTVNGRPERVQGVFSYPRCGKNLPAIFWSMGGMAAANPSFPEIFAKKGYACLAITLPHPIRHSRARFDADNPREGNFTLLARDQMRGVTYLSRRPEVNPDKMGVGGASYGGVFATLLAGIDPRLKMGMSFFGGGNHALGTSLPQFTKLKSLDEVEVWNRTVDGAFRHKERDIPFFWAVAFNDNWFSFPAVIQTYRDAISADKRLVIMPWWRHGFPENVDRSIEDFPDTTLTKTRPPYNNPGPIRIAEEGGKAVARFDWTGGNAIRKAELIVSYGEFTPWLGWLHRAGFEDVRSSREKAAAGGGLTEMQQTGRWHSGDGKMRQGYDAASPAYQSQLIGLYGSEEAARARFGEKSDGNGGFLGPDGRAVGRRPEVRAAEPSPAIKQATESFSATLAANKDAFSSPQQMSQNPVEAAPPAAAPPAAAQPAAPARVGMIDGKPAAQAIAEEAAKVDAMQGVAGRVLGTKGAAGNFQPPTGGGELVGMRGSHPLYLQKQKPSKNYAGPVPPQKNNPTQAKAATGVETPGAAVKRDKHPFLV